MKKMIILFLLCSIEGFSQQYLIQFTNDISGNRICRKIVKKNPKVTKDSLYSDTLNKGLTFKQDSNSIVKVSPNPTLGVINIKINKKEKDAPVNYFLYDLYGNNLFNEQSLYENFSINLERYSSSCYILIIKFQQHIEKLKIVKL